MFSKILQDLTVQFINIRLISYHMINAISDYTISWSESSRITYIKHVLISDSSILASGQIFLRTFLSYSQDNTCVGNQPYSVSILFLINFKKCECPSWKMLYDVPKHPCKFQIICMTIACCTSVPTTDEHD